MELNLKDLCKQLGTPLSDKSRDEKYKELNSKLENNTTTLPVLSSDLIRQLQQDINSSSERVKDSACLLLTTLINIIILHPNIDQSWASRVKNLVTQPNKLIHICFTTIGNTSGQQQQTALTVSKHYADVYKQWVKDKFEDARSQISNLVESKIFLRLDEMLRNGEELQAMIIWQHAVATLGNSIPHANPQIINRLLKQIELCFKRTSSDVQCNAYYSWSCLLEAFSTYPPFIVKKARLFMLPLKSCAVRPEHRSSHVDLSRAKTWCSLITSLGSYLHQHLDQVCTPLLFFCVGLDPKTLEYNQFEKIMTTHFTNFVLDTVVEKLALSSEGNVDTQNAVRTFIDTAYQNANFLTFLDSQKDKRHIGKGNVSIQEDDHLLDWLKKLVFCGIQILCALLGVKIPEGTFTNETSDFSLQNMLNSDKIREACDSSNEYEIARDKWICQTSQLTLTLLGLGLQLIDVSYNEIIINCIKKVLNIVYSDTSYSKSNLTIIVLFLVKAAVENEHSCYSVTTLMKAIFHTSPYILLSPLFPDNNPQFPNTTSCYFAEILLTPKLMRSLSVYSEDLFIHCYTKLMTSFYSIEQSISSQLKLLNDLSSSLSLCDDGTTIDYSMGELLWRCWCISAEELLDHIEDNIDSSICISILSYPLVSICNHYTCLNEIQQTEIDMRADLWTRLYRKLKDTITGNAMQEERNKLTDNLCRAIYNLPTVMLYNSSTFEFLTKIIYTLVNNTSYKIDIVLCKALKSGHHLSYPSIPPLNELDTPPEDSDIELGNITYLIFNLSKLSKLSLQSTSNAEDSSPSQLGASSSVLNMISALTSLLENINDSMLIHVILVYLSIPITNFIRNAYFNHAMESSTSDIDIYLEHTAKLWDTVCTSIQYKYAYEYNSDFLKVVSPLLITALKSQNDDIRESGKLLFLATFKTTKIDLEFPEELKCIFLEMRRKGQISFNIGSDDSLGVSLDSFEPLLSCPSNKTDDSLAGDETENVELHAETRVESPFDMYNEMSPETVMVDLIADTQNDEPMFIEESNKFDAYDEPIIEIPSKSKNDAIPETIIQQKQDDINISPITTPKKNPVGRPRKVTSSANGLGMNETNQKLIDSGVKRPKLIKPIEKNPLDSNIENNGNIINEAYDVTNSNNSLEEMEKIKLSFHEDALESISEFCTRIDVKNEPQKQGEKKITPLNSNSPKPKAKSRTKKGRPRQAISELKINKSKISPKVEARKSLFFTLKITPLDLKQIQKSYPTLSNVSRKLHFPELESSANSNNIKIEEMPPTMIEELPPTMIETKDSPEIMPSVIEEEVFAQLDDSKSECYPNFDTTNTPTSINTTTTSINDDIITSTTPVISTSLVTTTNNKSDICDYEDTEEFTTPTEDIEILSTLSLQPDLHFTESPSLEETPIPNTANVPPTPDTDEINIQFHDSQSSMPSSLHVSYISDTISTPSVFSQEEASNEIIPVKEFADSLLTFNNEIKSQDDDILTTNNHITSKNDLSSEQATVDSSFESVQLNELNDRPIALQSNNTEPDNTDTPPHLTTPSYSILKKTETPSPSPSFKKVSFADPLLKTHPISISPKSRKMRSQKKLTPTKLMNSLANAAKKKQARQKSMLDTFSPSNINTVGPIFPSMTSCSAPAQSISHMLASQSRGMEIFFQAKSIETIGDLASLTVKEVENLPIQPPKLKTLISAIFKYKSLFLTDSENNDDNSCEIIEIDEDLADTTCENSHSNNLNENLPITTKNVDLDETEDNINSNENVARIIDGMAPHLVECSSKLDDIAASLIGSMLEVRVQFGKTKQTEIETISDNISTIINEVDVIMRDISDYFGDIGSKLEQTSESLNEIVTKLKDRTSDISGHGDINEVPESIGDLSTVLRTIADEIIAIQIGTEFNEDTIENSNYRLEEDSITNDDSDGNIEIVNGNEGVAITFTDHDQINDDDNQMDLLKTINLTDEDNEKIQVDLNALTEIEFDSDDNEIDMESPTEVIFNREGDLVLSSQDTTLITPPYSYSDITQLTGELTDRLNSDTVKALSQPEFVDLHSTLCNIILSLVQRYESSNINTEPGNH